MIRPTLNVYALSKLVEPAELAGATAVVIDVLRAGTTIVYALAAGAEQVVPCLEVADARAMVEQFPAGTALLGGERQGLPIEGFDLGNSPDEYEPARVAGKTIVLTTTNGTRAMASAREADDSCYRGIRQCLGRCPPIGRQTARGHRLRRDGRADRQR